jgi:hypothetical protein
MVRALAGLRAFGTAPESLRGEIPGATTGLAGAITGPCDAGADTGVATGLAVAAAGLAVVAAGLALVAAGLAACPCACTPVDASPTIRLAIIPAVAKARIYFLGAGGTGVFAAGATDAAGGGGTGSENITRPLTSS